MERSDLDSSEELYMFWWLEELKNNEYILEIKRDVMPFILSQSSYVQYTKELKTKSKAEQCTLLQEHIYTPDYLITWSKKGKDIFYSILGDNKNYKSYPLIAQKHSQLDRLRSYIEVKPIFDQNNMTRLFTINQKWTFDKFGEYINKVIPEKLFQETFTPARYLFTDKSNSNMRRKIKFKTTSINEYLSKYEGQQTSLF